MEMNTTLPAVASTPDQFGRSVRAAALISPVTGSSALTLPVVCLRFLLPPPAKRSRGFTVPPLVHEVGLDHAFDQVTALR